MDPDKAFNMTNAEDHLQYMFESTKDGKLTVPHYYEDLQWHRPSEDPNGVDYYIHYNIQWTEQDLKAVTDEYHALRADLETMAEKAKAFGEEKDFESDAEDVKAFLQDDRLFKVWDTYVRAWETVGFGPEEVFKYSSPESGFDSYFDKLALEEAMADGYQLTENDKDLYDLVKDTVVTEEELEEYDRYWECIAADAKRRVGDAPEALQLVLRAKRVWKLLVLTAPPIIIQNESRELAQALALHRCATETEANKE